MIKTEPAILHGKKYQTMIQYAVLAIDILDPQNVIDKPYIVP